MSIEPKLTKVLPDSFDAPFAIQNIKTAEILLAVCWCTTYNSDTRNVGIIKFPADNILRREDDDQQLYIISETDFYKTFHVLTQITAVAPECATPEDRVAEQTA